MADNLTAPAAGAVLASDEIAGVHFPRTKIGFGADGAYADVTSGNRLPVDIGSGPFAVTGAFYQATQPVSLAGTVAVSGPLTDTQLRATAVPVSGSFWQTTQPVSASALPLPTGAMADSTFTTRIPTLGPKASSGSVSVAPASDATFAVSAATLPLPAGAATSAKQDAAADLLEAGVVLDAPFAITPHASNALEREIKAIAIVTGGTVVFRHPNEGSDRTITLPAGMFPLRATHIRATSTAATLTGF